MRGLVAITSLLSLVLVGCGGSKTTASSATPSRSPAASPSRSPKATPTPARAEKPTSNVKDCYDGNCRLKVSKPITIPLNEKKFHYSSLEIVHVTSSTLSFHVPYPGGGGADQTLSPGGGGGFGFRSDPSIEVTLVSMKHGKGLLSLAVQPHL